MGSKVERYTYRIEWSEEDGVFVARCVEFPGLGGHGRSQEAALRQIKVAVAEALKWLRDDKREAPEPLGSKKFRGHLSLRVPPEVHRELAIKAAEEKVSINQLILSKII
ncbi:MAG: toxin-antitoxin system HicB family antitoxin [Candidatus Aminicenantes bacterium]|nr:toxin-antitoxin system HicB family antitoxin [Acidobacteriota bacterium]MCG2812949.1 toxin-antitoxin system HicB family antitoxin [Candidatus Aminicenantes bacterium]